jgi:hypothetical protein
MNMKKTVIVLALIAGVCCSCNSNMKKVQKLIEEYSQNADTLCKELNASDVRFTNDEWAYVEAEREAQECETIIKVGRNLDLNVAKVGYTQKKLQRLICRAEILRVPLNAEQRAFAQKYWDMKVYASAQQLLERWVQIHS